MKACNFIKKKTLAQVFSYEFCKIFRNNFFYRTPPLVDSEYYLLIQGDLYSLSMVK